MVGTLLFVIKIVLVIWSTSALDTVFGNLGKIKGDKGFLPV
jgi:hypothetical protein